MIYTQLVCGLSDDSIQLQADLLYLRVIQGYQFTQLPDIRIRFAASLNGKVTFCRKSFSFLFSDSGEREEEDENLHLHQASQPAANSTFD